MKIPFLRPGPADSAPFAEKSALNIWYVLRCIAYPDIDRVSAEEFDLSTRAADNNSSFIIEKAESVPFLGLPDSEKCGLEPLPWHSLRCLFRSNGFR